ncbi:efflux RND transporter periplasmic adaptor subunit [Sphingosinicella sp. LY1275]|uniref:efflux RND transporter periplasmic adaptor subunit n=1 Tax=Sphingosinicella sp. LY1275 TaxID=3095379 RepID=UPI002ADEC40C|nr:efflux RND transporter periplasmic adaptor subunit [Sphingosinicella sp. LY1275]MEA1015088.1 efflux RND transporter periplasmic adaptor subunit [Sphingosinicella sp. LY1275]
MNFETAKWGRGALEGEVVDEEILRARRKRRNIILAALAAVVIAGVAIVMLMGGGDKGAPAAAAKAPESVPAVSVIVPGRHQVATTISANGTLAARRDMPVGVSGEGGMVSRVLVEPGQWVGAGQTLAVIERSVQAQEAQQLAASIEVARADARLAQQELDRAQALVSRGFVSKADVERRVATRDAANARVRVAQAQLGQTRARIGRLDVRAPAAGLVLDRMVEPGQVVSAGSGALFRIAMGGEMELKARLSQEDLARIRIGVPATVTPVGSSRTFTGKVWQVSPVIDPVNRQGEARIALAYDPLLRPGGFAGADLVAGQVDAPMLPESAVQSDSKGNFVYVIDGNDKVVRRDVKVGQVADAGVPVIAGLAGNERVVQSAGAFLNPGDKVRPVRAAAR